jgi:hypothetical protein
MNGEPGWMEQKRADAGVADELSPMTGDGGGE